MFVPTTTKAHVHSDLRQNDGFDVLAKFGMEHEKKEAKLVENKSIDADADGEKKV